MRKKIIIIIFIIVIIGAVTFLLLYNRDNNDEVGFDDFIDIVKEDMDDEIIPIEELTDFWSSFNSNEDIEITDNEELLGMPDEVVSEIVVSNLARNISSKYNYTDYIIEVVGEKDKEDTSFYIIAFLNEDIKEYWNVYQNKNYAFGFKNDYYNSYEEDIE